ncbi:hypothetical protein [Kineosporia babensis]|uniref:Uncharacterized protein n=1 Tax=Kineosporia babensis TaxID=499548 RepID=A0A9X1NF93_9ACTN|nr:hypothetical protein [Kineosporia babensis]MCD5312750.1 hypothetical protein [Kineosporia babensis]
MKKVLITLLVVGVLGVALLAGGGFFLWKLFKDNTVSEATYAAIKVGDTTDAVTAQLPEGMEFTENEVYGADNTEREPSPKGATCDHYLSSDVSNESGTLYYRFCFSDGALVEKSSIVGA